MSGEQVRPDLPALRQQIVALQREKAGVWQEIDVVIEDLHLMFEEMQTTLESAKAIEEGLLKQNQQLTEQCSYYYELFQFSPIAHLVTDPNGLILDANRAIAQLLNVPQQYLLGKPLSVYVAESDRRNFRLKLNQLSQSNGRQVWSLSFCPRRHLPLAVQLHIDPVCDDAGLIETLRMVIHSPVALSPSPPYLVPQSLDGLRVLVVDDEADVREFITAVLESYGIGVRAVDDAAAALQVLERFQPDVLVSDIRLPGGDGYTLIRQVRALEARQGRHIPAAAITAHLDEDREKALEAGFEAHLHKLAQPIELVEMVAQLAGRGREF